ncbi:MAG: KH domain-containing protein [Tissierellia bacterium]|nr:KH domain-containing protein [Tissierellia bacterium]
MEELILHITKSLVEYPNEVSVTVAEESGNTLIINLTVAESDMGKVIGRQGRVAKAIRGILKAVGTKHNKEVFLNIG